MRRRNAAVTHIEAQSVSIQFALPGGMSFQGLEFGPEKERAARPAVIEGLFAEAIPRQMEHPLDRIPNRKSEHSVETLDRVLDAPPFERGKHDFRIGMATPTLLRSPRGG